MLSWVIYCGDGSTFHNLDGEPLATPLRNFQTIANDSSLWSGNYDGVWRMEG